MYKNKIKSFYLDHSNLIISVIFFCFYSYFFIAFLPELSPIGTSLDPSWQYAISQAANNNLVFGKDIVFTYGPLGYLIGGSALENNFFQILYLRWLVYLTLFIVSLIRIKTAKNPIHKLVIGTAIILSLSIGLSGSTDYQILFIYLILLTFDSLFERFPTLFPSLLGAIAGICLLTKFSLGISIIGSLSLFLIISLIKSIQAKSKSTIKLNFLALLNSYLATVSTVWLFFYPNVFLQSLQNIIIIFLFSFLLAYLGSYTKIIDKLKSVIINNNATLTFPSSEEAKNVEMADILKSSNFRIVFYTLYIILLLFIIFHSSYSLIDYFRNSLEISSGYSSAMSIVGDSQELALALSTFLVVLLLFIIGKNNHLNLASALIFVLWIAFKHGFVRQDNHVSFFALTVPIVVSLYLIKIESYRELKTSCYIFLFVCIASLLISPYITPQSISQKIVKPQWSQLTKLNPKNVLDNVSSIFHIEEFKNKILSLSAKNLSALQLPNNIIKMVGNQTIDIIPWEIALAPANNLNWQPRPIFQSYSAYTDKLDEINFISLSSKPRDFMFYNFQSIGRHPFFDEPKTFFYIFCNYQPATLLSNGYSILSILQKNKSNRCLPPQPENNITVTWNQVYSMNFSTDSIIRAKIQFHYSILGKLQKIFFRVPPVAIVVDYVDGSSQTYRIIPENSDNGVIISHLPRSDQEAVSFLQGDLPARVKSFRLETGRPSLYQPSIEINFLSSKLR